MHCGFGFGIVFVSQALAELDWDPPRYMGTAFQNAWVNPIMWNAILGWTGLDQYDEGNAVGQAFLDQYEAAYGRRPLYCVPVMNRDFATVLLHAFADAHPLTPRGVQGRARAGEDDPGRRRRARHLPLVRPVDPSWAGWAPATWWPASSIPTASTPTSSDASEIDDGQDAFEASGPSTGPSPPASWPTLCTSTTAPPRVSGSW